jgi:hypothetical protein
MKFESTFWLEQTIEALSFGSDTSLRGAIVEAEPDLHQADPHRIDQRKMRMVLSDVCFER